MFSVTISTSIRYSIYQYFLREYLLEVSFICLILSFVYLSESAFVDVDNYHENMESKQNKTLENLQEIQEAIVFMNQVWLEISPPGHGM